MTEAGSKAPSKRPPPFPSSTACVLKSPGQHASTQPTSSARARLAAAPRSFTNFNEPPVRVDGVADELHLGRLRRLHLACADGAALDDAATPAPADPRLRIPGLDTQCAGRAAGGDQPRYLPRRQNDRRDLPRP